MAISFNQIPGSVDVPSFLTEVDTSRAQQGAALQEYAALIIGQRLSTGSKPAEQVDLVTSADQAKLYYGAGSQAAVMADAYFNQDNFSTPLEIISLDDDGGAVAAAGSITFTGPATAAGTVVAYIGGIRVTVAVADTDTADDIKTAAIAAINAETDRQLEASDGGAGIVTLTARNLGEAGNSIDIRLNHFTGEELPAGVGATVVQPTGGTTNADIADAIAAMDVEKQYNVIAHPYTDAANLTTLETELDSRYGPIRQIQGSAFCGARDSVANLVTLGDSRNSPHNSIIDSTGPNSPWEMAAAVMSRVAVAGQADPARPFQTLSLSGILSESVDEKRTFAEREALLGDGISTLKSDSGGVKRVERLVTTYQENSFGSPDKALRDVNTMLTLMFLRFSVVNLLSNRYARHKLADDGTNFGPGQAIITPNVARAEMVQLFRQWEENGLVEGGDQFKADLIVERNSSDPNRLDILLPPDFVNQFRVAAIQIQFRL